MLINHVKKLASNRLLSCVPMLRSSSVGAMQCCLYCSFCALAVLAACSRSSVFSGHGLIASVRKITVSPIDSQQR